MKTYNKPGLVALLAFAFQLVAAQAQQPRIGLALSGGGAKGLAHIGILKAIDSAGLKIDLVSGTSMGSIVGGLYAAGYTPDSIEQMARNLDWKLLLSNNVSMRSYIMEEKSEYGKYAVELTAEKGKIGLPTGFLESQELWLKLQEIFFPVAHIKDFDKLPRPFRCIGTDLATGDAVVLSKGDIVSAIRSSMAIPGVFSSVDYMGKRLVDGGVVRNFPVKDVINMGANYTIGVSVSSPLKDVKELDNAFKILTQVVFLNENKDRLQESALCNLLIDVPMGSYTSASFNKANEIIDLGIEIGRQFYPAFKKLADSLNHRETNPSRFMQNMQGPPRIGDVTVTGLKPANRMAFYHQLSLKTPENYTAGQITQKLRNAFAYRMYKNITYTLEPMDSGSYRLHAKTNPEAATAIKAGIHYNRFTGFSVIGNLTLRNFFTSASRSMVSLNLGDNFRGLAEHLQLFGYNTAWSNRTQLYAEFQDLPYMENFRQLGGYRLRYYRIDNQVLNTARRRWSGGAGARLEFIGIDPSIEQGTYLDGNNRFFMVYGTTTYNSFDRPFYAPRGFKMDILAGYVMGLSPNLEVYENRLRIGDVRDLGLSYGNYLRATVDAQKISTLSKKLANVTHLQAGVNFGPNSSLLNSFVIGGNMPVTRNQITFLGLNEGELLTESAIALQTGFRWNAFGDAYLTIAANAMHYDFVKKPSDNTLPRWITGAGVTFGYNLPIGPFEYTVMYSKQAGWGTYINVGFPFK